MLCTNMCHVHVYIHVVLADSVHGLFAHTILSASCVNVLYISKLYVCIGSGRACVFLYQCSSPCVMAFLHTPPSQPVA